MERLEISDKYKWNLKDIYSSIEDYNKDKDIIQNLSDELLKYKGTITTNADNLLSALKINEKIDTITSKLYVYANMNLHIDTTDSFFQELTGNLNIIMTKINEKLSFLITELLKARYSVIEKYINENNGLKRFSYFLEQIFNEKKHVLGLKEEKILSRASNILNVPDEVFSNLSDADMIFPDVSDSLGNKLSLTKGSYYKYISSNDRTLRTNSFNTLYSKFREFNNTFANTMNSNVLITNFLYKTRKYKSALNMHLSGNKIDEKIYHDLIKIVNNNLDKIYKYFSLRKKVLKYNELHMYDLSVNLIDEENKEYNYDTAKELVLNALTGLGKDYVNDLNLAFDNNWIDVYETKGKRSGAYSWGCYPNHPYVLLNYQNRLDDVSTLAHELGHAMHRYYSNNNQDYYYSDNEIFVAEIASTVNEILLKLYLLNNTNNKNEKLNIYNELMDDIKNTIYRQTMFAEFEINIHKLVDEDEVLSASRLNKLYYDLVKKYHGDNVIIDEDIKYEWSRIPHFYTPFYVYQYATGLSIAIDIAYKIYKGDSEMLKKYLEFLKSGSNDYPTNLVEKMGINIETAVKDALNIFEGYIKEFESLY